MTASSVYADTIDFEGWRFVIISSQKGVRILDLRGTPPERLAERLRARLILGENREAVRQLTEYLARTRKEFDLPLDLHGTPFQREVWNELLHVPYGKTVSYSEIAARIGRPKAARAVGAAVGSNPVPIIIPCHRVIGKDGSLVGFGGGLDLKQRLLALEGTVLD